jgi:hypothetical protein
VTPVTRLLLWQGVDAWRAEAARVELAGDGLRASGTQLGVDPLPYRLDYELAAGPAWVTRRLSVTAAGDRWRRHLDLRSDGAGSWTCDAELDGEVDLPAPGGDMAAVAGALDCDLGLCPLTNVMPVRRHDLHRREGAADLLMAWVSVPDLAVVPSRQRYEHVRTEGGSSTVRFVSGDFLADLELDADGLVVFYPDLARRMTP